MSENKINVQIFQAIDDLISSACKYYAQDICHSEFEMIIDEPQALRRCKQELDRLINSGDSGGSDVISFRKRIYDGILDQHAKSGQYLFPNDQLSSLEDLGFYLGTRVAETDCGNGSPGEAQYDPILFGSATGGEIPEAHAHSSLVALGILDKNNNPNWVVIGGIAIASLALGIVGYRYFSSRLFSKPVQQAVEIAEEVVEKLAA